MAITEQKIGSYIIVAQTTYYVYENQENRDADKANLITSDKNVIAALKKKLRSKIEKLHETMGIICPTVDDFITWSLTKRRGRENKKFKNTVRRFTVGNTTCVCITRPVDCCGLTLDDYLVICGAETKNKDYKIIMEVIKPTLRPRKK